MTVAEVRPRSHACFQRLVRFDLRLTTKTGLHVGAGKNPALVGSEMPVLRDAAGRPLIPGSSLRGVIRAAIAALVDTLDLDSRRPVATLDVAASAFRREGWREFTERWNEQMGVVERLFGRIAQRSGDFSYASRLFISDLVPSDAVVVELRDGVAIDRETRTAAGGLKFDLEVVPAGTEFDGKVRLHDPEDYELGLVAQALSMLTEGLTRLGGKAARGLGLVEVGVGPVSEVTAESLLFGEDGGSGDGISEFESVVSRLGEPLKALALLARSEGKAGPVVRTEDALGADTGDEEE
jgi:CRISPR-associated RAMP protein (TIGR02581 family)